MFGIRDYIMTTALLCLVVLAGLVYWMNVRLEHAEAVADSARAAVSGYEARDKAQVKVTADKEKAHATLSERLQDNPEWADQPVPDDLADLLRKH